MIIPRLGKWNHQQTQHLFWTRLWYRRHIWTPFCTVVVKEGTWRQYLCRLRRRIIWIGGWEKANCEGWRLRLDNGHWMHPTPWSLFRRLTFYGWGWDLQLREGVLVKSREGLYISPNGTPQHHGTRWIWRARGLSRKRGFRRI